MAGLYVHIPFCRQACHYCNFHFSTSFQKKDELIQALINEIELQKGYLRQEIVETVYFGGGTPSALPPGDIDILLDTIRNHHNLASDVESTLEANPDDITSENLLAWKSSGINRLSIGVQVFQQEILKNWNRSHTSIQARECISLTQQSGIKNITADLIYGGPGLSDAEWESNIQTLLDSGIPHVSCYALTVEPGTALFHQIQKGKTVTPDDEQASRQYKILQTKMKEHGFLQYEISNFSKPGFESKHNKSYWTGTPYLGIGPSAHSYDGVSRQWNVSNNIRYIASIAEGRIPYEIEVLTDEQRYNEWVMTGLRTSMGIDRNQIEALGNTYIQNLEKQVQPFIQQGKIGVSENGNFVLLPDFYFFADGIASELFYN